MADYTEPTQEEFNSAETIALDILNTSSPSVMTKTGSVVRELVIRPFAYLYAWASANLETLRKASTVKYLADSQLTENSVADDVASNYFVTRNTGTKSKGVITLTVTAPFTSIAAGSTFSAGGETLVTPTDYVLTSATITDTQDDTTYIEMFTVVSAEGNITYIANIPVEASTAGNVEIQTGTSVSVNFSNPFISAAELTAAVTGGKDTETDAELMERCKYATACAGVGSYNGLRRLLNNSPVTVTGLSVVAGEDAPIFRARYNNTNINPGGYVDCYIKTQSQYSTKAITVSLASATKTVATDTGYTTYTFEVYDSTCAGFYGVTSLYATHGIIKSYSVTYASTDSLMDGDGARLSRYQKAIISFVSEYNDETSALVYVAYMPNIVDVDSYLNKDTNKFIGQDVCAKAAVPVNVTLTCACACETALTDSETALLKQTVVDYINNLSVGTGTLNFSDIIKRCRQILPKAELRLPCAISATYFLKNGTTDSYYSSTGLLNIADPVNTASWNYKLCFFSTTKDAIRIETL